MHLKWQKSDRLLFIIIAATGAVKSGIDMYTAVEIASIPNGDVAQMVERSLSMRQVVGSMPIISTYFSFALGVYTVHTFLLLARQYEVVPGWEHLRG